MAPIFGQLQTPLLAKLTYASSAWWKLIGAERLLRLQLLVSRAVKQGFLPSSQSAFDIIFLFEKNDVELFNAIMNYHNPFLNHLLAPVKQGAYNLRQRIHNRVIPDMKDSHSSTMFVYFRNIILFACITIIL